VFLPLATFKNTLRAWTFLNHDDDHLSFVASLSSSGTERARSFFSSEHVIGGLAASLFFRNSADLSPMTKKGKREREREGEGEREERMRNQFSWRG